MFIHPESLQLDLTVQVGSHLACALCSLNFGDLSSLASIASKFLNCCPTKRNLLQCVGAEAGEDPCAVRGDPTILRPGPGAKRLEDLVVRLLAPAAFRSNQCLSL